MDSGHDEIEHKNVNVPPPIFPVAYQMVFFYCKGQRKCYSIEEIL